MENNNIHLNGQPLALIDDQNNVYYYLNDHLGTPQMLTDQNQQVAWQARYTPFGEATLTVAQVAQPLRFPGQYFDQETGLHYNYHRYYDPKVGRYLTSDPIGLAGGINTYAYVGNNPIAYVDPDGLRRANPWNRFQQRVVGQGLTRSQMSSLYRQLQLRRLAGPQNPDLQEALENLPDIRQETTEEALDGLECNFFGVCKIDIRRCRCDDGASVCSGYPEMKRLAEDDPNCYCWTETVELYL